MPRTQVPEEGQRVVNVSELKNTKPRSEAVIRTEGKNVTNDGLSNLYWWDPNGNPSNADGKTIIESNVSGYQNGEANEGVWRRMFKPSSEIESQIENSTGNQGAVQYSDGSGGFLGNTGYLYIDNSDGSVGVGTSSPVENFSVDGDVGVKSGYLWVKNGNNAYVTGGMHVGGSSVPANALEISGNFTSSGWGGVNDKFSVNAPAPFGPNAVGTEELQVDGSVGADSYNFYHPNSSWNIRPSGGQGDLLIHQNFGSNFSLIEARTRDVDVTDTSTDSEATLALTRSDSAETAVEFLDLYNNGYYSSGSVRHGLRVQKRGGGKLRNFEFEWDDGNNQYLGYSIKPPTDLTNGDGAKIHFNVPIGILTASPSYALDVNGDINAQGELRSSGNIVSPDSVSNAHHTRPSAGEGLSDNSNTFDVRLDIDKGGSNVTTAYGLNFGSNIDVIDDGSNKVTIDVDTGSLPAAAGNAGAVQYASSSGGFLGNINYLYVDDSNGNVGIGTSSPSNLLSVDSSTSGEKLFNFGSDFDPQIPNTPVGTIRANDNSIAGIGMKNTSTGGSADFRFTVLDDSNQGYLAFHMPGSGNTKSLFGRSRSSIAGTFYNHLSGGSRAVYLGNVVNDDLFLGTNNTERLTITGGGDVGIGTSSPGEKLSVNGNLRVVGTGSSAKINIGESGAYPQSIQMANGFSVFETTSADLIQINKGSWGRVAIPSGDVGIGTTTPSYKLDVNGDINAQNTLRSGGNVVSPDSVSDAHHTRPSAGQGIADNSNTFDLRLDIDDGGSNVARIYNINFGNQINVIDDGSNQATVEINDGSGSGLDADTLDGIEGSNYARTDVAETFNDDVYFTGGNVGIGTNTPDSTLDVDGNVIADDLRIQPESDPAAGISGAAIQRRWIFNQITAGSIQPFGQWFKAEEGAVQLEVALSSAEPSHSGTNLYIIQGGYSKYNSSWSRVKPSFQGRGHGDGPEGFELMVRRAGGNGAESYQLGVGIESNLADKDIEIGVTELTGGMDFSDISSTGSVSFSSAQTFYSHRNVYIGESLGVGNNSPDQQLDVSNQVTAQDYYLREDNVWIGDHVDDSDAHHTRPTAGNGIEDNSNTFDLRLDLDQSGTNVASVYQINIGSGLNAIDDGGNQATVEHADTGSDQSTGNSGGTFIQSVSTDGRGHVDSVSSNTFSAGDGLNLSGTTFNARIAVQDGGTGVGSGAYLFNFGSQLNVNDDGSNQVSVSLNDGGGSGLGADTLDGKELNEFARKRITYHINSGSGTRLDKFGEFRGRNGRFRITIVGSVDQGSNSERQIVVTGYKRGSDANGQYRVEGASPVSDPVDIILTETTNDANGDGYNDAYLYVRSADFSQAKIIIEHEFAFTEDRINGVGSTTGTEVLNTYTDAPNQEFNVGQLGINTDNPSTTFEAVGRNEIARVNATSGNQGRFAFSQAENRKIGINWGTTVPFIFSDDGNDLRFGAGFGTEYMRIQDNGNVGIGTSSPGTKLEVNGVIKSSFVGTTGNPALQLSTGAGLYVDSNNNFAITEDNSVQAITISGGNVGIGTNSPDVKLDVEGGADLNGRLNMRGNGITNVENLNVSSVSSNNVSSHINWTQPVHFNNNGGNNESYVARFSKNGASKPAILTEDIQIDDFTFDQDSGDLVLSDNNGVELIRQPKAGATQFIQGAEIGSIEAPTDSFTQVINAPSTSAAASGDLVGYTFAVDNQSILEVKADADGSGGITNKRVSFANGVEIGGVAAAIAGDGLVSSGGNLNVRLPITDGGSPVANVFQFNIGGALEALDDGGNQTTIRHLDTSSQGNVSTGGATVIDDINVDGYGHVTNMNTQNRRLSDWNVPTSDLNISDENLDNVGNLNVSSIDSNNGGNPVQVNQGFDMNSNAVTFGNFDVEYNSNSESLDFVYTG